MKNISRRVFIKGLAVAGVAAAASTVLAGCNTNMIPGTDNGTEQPEVVPTTGNTYTFKDGDNTLTISAPGFFTESATATVGKESIYFSLKVTNELGETVKFVDAYSDVTAAATADYYVLFAAKLFDKNGDNSTAVTLDATADLKNYKNPLLSSSNSLTDGNRIDNGALTLDATQDDTWTKAEVTVKVFKPYKPAQGTNYNYLKETNPDGEYTFTFINK